MTRAFFWIVSIVPLITLMLAINLLKHLFTKFSGERFFKKIYFTKTNSVCNSSSPNWAYLKEVIYVNSTKLVGTW